MYIKVRLYKKYDLDLCKLYISRPRYFTRQLGDALRAYYRGKPYQADFQSIGIKEPPNVIEIKLLLDEKFDADIINALKSIIPKQRNSFIKKLFRHYLTFDTLQLFMLNSPNFGVLTDFNSKTETPSFKMLKDENEPILELTEASDDKKETFKDKKTVIPVISEIPEVDNDPFTGFDDVEAEYEDSDEPNDDAYQSEVGDIFAGLL